MVSAPHASLARWDVTAAEKQREMSKVASIVLPLDGSAASRAAVLVALRFAQLYDAVLHLVYAGPEPEEPKALLTFLGVSPHEMPGAVIDHLSGAVAEAITQCARQLPRSLVVMCTGRAHGSDPNRFGSTAEAVLASGPELIVLVPPEHSDKPWRVGRVLLAHDGSPASDLAAGRAAGLSLLAGAETIALHVAARKGSS